MNRLRPGTSAIIAIIIGALLITGGGLSTSVRAAGEPDPAEVVIVLDFSASILKDSANRKRFGAALERIAARVDATSADLIAGDATVTIIQFATRAADYPGCADIKLFDSPENVGRFADCLRSVAKAYRNGLAKPLTKKIGIDTNYVAAMEQAARHLPADLVRPSLILLTDGKHDVKGVAASAVKPAADRLFGSRSPFALLPVGMGLKPKQRAALGSGLMDLRVIRDMPACVSGTEFEWPQVVFDSADQAGNAVAVALQDATCTFTVAPTPTPSPTPTPTPAPRMGVVTGIRLTPGDASIELFWASPASEVPITDFRSRCRTAGGDWIESTEGVSTETSSVVEGLTNGAEYECEVAPVGGSVEGEWTAASATVTPIGPPAAPAKPAVEAQDGAITISVSPDPAAPVPDFHYQCSSDNGATWPADVDLASASGSSTRIGGLANGTEYVCRVFASNASGVSEASAVSDAIRPCASAFDCNPLLLPIVGLLVLVLILGLLAVLFVLYRGRTRGYVVAVVDVVYTANLGHGSKLGIRFLRDPATKSVTGIVADSGSGADFRIRNLRGGNFEVADRVGSHVTASGERLIAIDSLGGRHDVVLRAFATNTAAEASSTR